MSAVGWRQYVEQGAVGSLRHRLLSDDDQTEITLAGSHQIAIYAPGGSSLVSTVNVTSTSGAVATYTRTWDAATFDRLRGFKAVWSLQDASANDYSRTTYFEVVRRIFRSQMTDAWFTGRHPYLSSRLPSGLSDFSSYRERAWMEIEQKLERMIPEVKASVYSRYSERPTVGGVAWAYVDSTYPGNLFNPEDFMLAHELYTLADFFDAIAIDVDEVSKAERYRNRAMAAFERASAKLAFDRDDDGLFDTTEREMVLTGIAVVR